MGKEPYAQNIAELPVLARFGLLYYVLSRYCTAIPCVATVLEPWATSYCPCDFDLPGKYKKDEPPLMRRFFVGGFGVKKDIAAIVGGGYGDFWRFRGRYRVVKGGRAAKKSATSSIWFIYHMMKYPLANLLVVRRHANSHKDSTFAQLQWAIDKLGVGHLWCSKKSPLELIYRPTGQRILFRGLDDPHSVHSITVEHGVLCWVWVEEAFQIRRERDFDKLDLSIRGNMPERYFKQFTLTFNPWSAEHWLKGRFFDRQGGDVLAKTVTYRQNEFLDAKDLVVFNEMRERFPRRYEVEGLGNWGIAEGLIYDNWEEYEFEVAALLEARGTDITARFGLDFGFTVDPTAFVALLADEERWELFVFDEHYQRGMLNEDIARMLRDRGYGKERIVADSAEPKSIAELRRAGFFLLSYRTDGRVVVEQDINTLVNGDYSKGNALCKNRVIRTLDEIANTVSSLFENYYIGKVDNNEVGRSLFKSDILDYCSDLVAINAITSFGGSEDVDVLAGNDGDSVVVHMAVQPVDAMEKVYMSVEVTA